MKDTDFSKLLAATTTGTSEMEAFFSNEFIEWLKGKCHIYYVNQAQARMVNQ